MRRHAIAPLLVVDMAWNAQQAVEFRHFDSDEGRLQAEIATVMLNAMRDYHMRVVGRPAEGRDAEMMLDLAHARSRQLVEGALRDHIHRTIEDALA